MSKAQLIRDGALTAAPRDAEAMTLAASLIDSMVAALRDALPYLPAGSDARAGAEFLIVDATEEELDG